MSRCSICQFDESTKKPQIIYWSKPFYACICIYCTVHREFGFGFQLQFTVTSNIIRSWSVYKAFRALIKAFQNHILYLKSWNFLNIQIKVSHSNPPFLLCSKPFLFLLHLFRPCKFFPSCTSPVNISLHSILFSFWFLADISCFLAVSCFCWAVQFVLVP